MGRYDFLKDEETKKKLKERQKKMITKKKQEEVREGKEPEEEESEEEQTGPRVYTKESGKIGGVIYPEKKHQKPSRKPSEQLMGEEEEENPSKDNPGSDEMPIKLRHTDKTKVGKEDRPSPPEKKQKRSEEDKEAEKEGSEKTEKAREEIWQ